MHPSCGIIPRSVEKLFMMINKRVVQEKESSSVTGTYSDYSVVVSYFEICKLP